MNLQQGVHTHTYTNKYIHIHIHIRSIHTYLLLCVDVRGLKDKQRNLGINTTNEPLIGMVVQVHYTYINITLFEEFLSMFPGSWMTVGVGEKGALFQTLGFHVKLQESMPWQTALLLWLAYHKIDCGPAMKSCVAHVRSTPLCWTIAWFKAPNLLVLVESWNLCSEWTNATNCNSRGLQWLVSWRTWSPRREAEKKERKGENGAPESALKGETGNLQGAGASELSRTGVRWVEFRESSKIRCT